jgi:asparagine synthase (glutamine-hydrolysing)
MCGIAGFVDRSATTEQSLASLRRMTDSIRYRGPDAEGAWFDEQLRVGLGHRRLSIIDLSAAGSQPMVSASARYVITYNGEIYNHVRIRDELLQAQPGIVFRGHSDTEVMLAAFETWGIEQALQKFNGMFAFALLDRAERRLHLARDRIGEKPLYYAQFGEAFVFGSELKALKRHPAWNAAIDRGALASFLHYGYVPAPGSIYANVRKLSPGAWLEVDVSRPGSPQLRERRYWSAQEVATRAFAQTHEIDERAAGAQLEELLRDAVDIRMAADVPLGAFLSGGIDSSTIVAVMQSLSPRPIRTFAIGFGEKRFNEAESARAVAQHLGTDHTELYVSPSQALEVIPKLPEMYDEPFADASQIPTYLVSHLARQHVTVSLSGDGGDELFSGYDRYSIAMNIWRGLRRAPLWLRRATAATVRSVPMRVWNALGKPLPERISAGRTGDRMHKLADRFELKNFEALYDSLLALWQKPELAMAGGFAAHGRMVQPIELCAAPSEYEQMMVFDLHTYLPDDILVKVDRASMAVSLEARVPLLDHRLIEFALQLPLSLKRRAGVTKWLLRQQLYKLVPQSLVDRPKQGFSVPIEHWLRGELREWATDLLSEERLRRDGFLDPQTVPALLQEHLSGRRSWTSQLWTALMFQAWLARA